MGTTKYTSTLIAVSDMEKSKQFYRDVLGMKVVADFGSNVTLDGGLVLQTMDTWKSFIRTDSVVLPNNAGELYFEEADMDAFCKHLQSFPHTCGISGSRLSVPCELQFRQQVLCNLQLPS